MKITANLLAVALTLGLCLAMAGAALAQALEPLAIVLQGGQRQSFQVEVARNDADRAQGLMFRRSMPADRGMLFDFGRVEPVGGVVEDVSEGHISVL